MENPLVSIIIPCFNQAQYLNATLNSILAQTYSHWECVIINDGSNDDTEEIAMYYTKMDHRFQYHYKLNGGVSSARNYGLEFINGEYVQFLDCDDLISENKIQLQIENLSNHQFEKEIVSVVKHLYFYNNDKMCVDINKSALDVICHDYENPLELIIDSWKNNTGFAIHTWLISKAIIDKCGPWDETLMKNEDGEYISRILSRTKRIMFCPEAYAFYRHNSKSICNSYEPRKDIDQLKAVRLITKIISEYRFDKDVKDAIHNLYMFYLYPSDLSSDYFTEYKKDLKMLGYNFDLFQRGKAYKFLYQIIGKEKADRIYTIKNILISHWKKS